MYICNVIYIKLYTYIYACVCVCDFDLKNMYVRIPHDVFVQLLRPVGGVYKHEPTGHTDELGLLAYWSH